MNKKLILTTIILILIFSWLQNVSASKPDKSKLQHNIEYISEHMSIPVQTPACVFSNIELTVCIYAEGNLRITTSWYQPNFRLIVVQWKGEVVAAVDHQTLYYLKDHDVVNHRGGKWVGVIHKVVSCHKKSTVTC